MTNTTTANATTNDNATTNNATATTATPFTFTSAVNATSAHFYETALAGNNNSGNVFMSAVRLTWNTAKLVPLAVNATLRAADYAHGLTIATETGRTLNNMNMVNTLNSVSLKDLGASMATDTVDAYTISKAKLGGLSRTAE